MTDDELEDLITERLRLVPEIPEEGREYRFVRAEASDPHEVTMVWRKTGVTMRRPDKGLERTFEPHVHDWDVLLLNLLADYEYRG